MSSSARLRTRRARGWRGTTSAPARPAARRQVVRGPHGGVLARQSRAEQQRIVGAERDRRPGRRAAWAAAPRSGRSRPRARRWRPGTPRARRRRRRSAPTARVPRPRGHRGRAGRREGRRGRCGCARARAAPRRAARAAGRPARRSRRPPAKSAVRPASLVVGQPEADHARARRTARPAGPASGRRGDAGCGWPRSRPPIPSPVSLAASRTASSTRSVKAVMPPNRAPYPLGSTWISSQRAAVGTSSSAASRTRRRTSSSVRSTDRATS